MKRRDFLRSAALLAATPALTPRLLQAASPSSTRYPYLGRTADYQEFSLVEPGRKVARVESWTRGSYGIVRVTTQDGRQGWGQLSSFEPDMSALVLHRQVARHVLGSDVAHIDALVDRVIDANMKFPWSYVCRALAGVDTAIWDLYGRLHSKPVWALLKGKPDPFPAYGSSMRRDITPAEEATRLARLRDTHGFRAFKIRLGMPTGHDGDAAPGRSPELIKQVRAAVGADVTLLADGNSCYTPPKAIEMGKLMQDQNYYWFEEPCPYWELEWTAEVAAALDLNVSGGEQDNDMAQWRRMIRMNAVDILQPDLCYNGGFTRSWRVAKLAEAAGKKVVPHSSHLSLITVFSLHYMAAIPNAGPYLEFTIEPETNRAEPLYMPDLAVRDGRVKLPEEPGWGVEINPAWLEKADYKKSEL